MVQAFSTEREDDLTRHRFTRLAEQFYEPVYHFIARQTPRPADAEDLTQQAFIRAFHSFERFDPSRDFAPWIYTIARRCIADFYRQQRATLTQIDESAMDPSPDPREIAARVEHRESIWDAASELKPKLHQVLLLHYQENFTIQETARIMGISQTHVKVLLFRARNALKRRLTPTSGGNVI